MNTGNAKLTIGWSRKVVINVIALMLLGHYPAPAAGGPVDKRIINEAMPMVDESPGGFFVTAPYINNLIVMNVRVYNNQHELILNVRSFGEPVNLLSADLADGRYSYETVSVFLLDAPVDQGANTEDEGISRNFGDFTIVDGVLYENSMRTRENQSGTHDEVSMIDRVIGQATHLAGVALGFLVQSAQAADLEAESKFPTITWDDIDNGSASDFEISVGSAANDSSGTWALYENVGVTNVPNPVIVVDALESGGINGALHILSSGNIGFANNAMYLNKASASLALGWLTTNANISISDTSPDILLRDETDTGETEWQLDDGLVSFLGRPDNGASWADIMSYDVNAPDNSLSIDLNGNLGIGTDTPQANLHVIGDIRTNDYFRGQSVRPGFWLDETGAGNKGANVVLDGGVLQFQRRAQGFGGYEAAPIRVFIAAPMNSFVVNASGFLGLGLNPTSPIHSVTGARLSAGGVWQNASSRDLKENIRNLDASEARTAFKALKPVTYNYKVDSEDAHIGFIAEDVPEIVASKDRTTLGSMDMVALVTRVVQDQQSTIEEKVLRIIVLEKQVADQKQQLDDQGQLITQQNRRMDKLETMLRLVAGLEDTDDELAENTR
ncbi:MAG: tail fiber domain-containing protein [Pseudomonadota bacterium]